MGIWGNNIVKAGWILLPALLLGGTGAQALEIYCNYNGGSLPYGTERFRDWHVVNYTVRKPQLPGQQKRLEWCSVTYQAFGGIYRSPEIVTMPKLGEAKTTANKLLYRSSKNGEDLVSVRFHYLGRTGQPESALVHYRIHVTDKPL